LEAKIASGNCFVFCSYQFNTGNVKGRRTVRHYLYVLRHSTRSCDGRARLTYGGREEMRAYRVLGEKHESKRPLGRSRKRWEDNIKL